MVVERIDKKFSPGFVAEQCASLPRFGRDHIGLTIVRRVFSRWPQQLPSGAKARLIQTLTARLKARPFKTIHSSSVSCVSKQCKSREGG